MVNRPDFGAWYERHHVVFQRARMALQQVVQSFIEDWSNEYGFRCEKDPIFRIKTQSRLLDKAIREGVDEPADLLGTPHPVTDIIGGRLLVRSLGDVGRLKRAIEENFPLDGAEMDDKNDSPTRTGYRALHVDGVVLVTVRNIDYLVPYELQVKTLAQDAWGYFTHDEAYAKVDMNEDARFEVVRGLQRVLAEQLNAADTLQLRIERLSRDIAYEIAVEEGQGPTLTYASVLNLIYSEQGVVIPISEAQEIVELASSLGMTSVDELASAIDLESDTAVEIAESWREEHAGRSPTTGELIRALLERSPE